MHIKKSFNSPGKVILYQVFPEAIVIFNFDFCSINMREIRVLNYFILLRKFLKLLQPNALFCLSICMCAYTHKYTHVDIHSHPPMM